MTVAELLGQLRERGIEVRAGAGDQLVVEAPKGAMTSELAGEIRARKAEILAFLAQGVARPATAAAPLVRVDRAGPLPLSFAQQRLWYLDQLDPGTPVYNVPMAFHLAGAVDAELLARALSLIAERHEVLRTTFHLGTRGPEVRVTAGADIPLAVHDVCDRPDPEAACRAILSEAARRPFDLATGPLLRAELIRTGVDRAVLLACSHHVVADGWSHDLFERELAALYDCLATGAPGPLPPLPVQYIDFAAWQRGHLSGAELDRQLGYWKEALAGELPVLELPTDHPRPGMQPSTGATERVELPASLLAPLTALGARAGATPFMVLLGAWAVLMARFSRQDDLVIGSPIAGRVREETEALIGCFANTLALRMDLSGEPTFRELLERVRRVCVGAYDHQDLPFERLVEELDPDRDLSRTPVFQTIFAFEETGARPDAPTGALRILSREAIHAGVSRTDLSVWVTATPGGLRATVEYCDALFEAETIRELLRCFETLLAAIAADPDRPVSRLPIVPQAMQQRLAALNDTARPRPDGGVHDLVAAQVARTPERVCVRWRDQSLTYAELEARAHRLAHHLLAHDVAPGDLVGVALDRGLDMLVAVLALFELGAAYVPLDPDYPPERLAFMIEDAGVQVALCDARSANAVGELTGALRLDLQADEIAARPATAPHRRSTEDDIAYVIYTSGSTGKPKGVRVPHRAVANFLATMADRPGLGADDVLLAVTTLSFDISVLELLLPLTVGACVVIADRDDAGDGARLAALLASSRATVMQATPATWRLLLAAGWTVGPGFRALCGGEAFPADLLAPLTERCAAVWNMYGPTETTVWSTCAQLAPDTAITIGTPIGNTRVYVVDRHQQPVPVGVYGELYIGGDGVTCGYLNRPELTAERFVADPVGGEGRVYRTGDLVRVTRDGQLAFGRRVDDQVKLRGFRIELGEIESVLAAHPGVAQCAVIVREDRAGDARLCAYVVADGAAPTATELRQHLRKALPEYMIPQHVVDLPRMPLTPAGKIDRRALPAPAQVAGAADQFVAPRTGSERYLAGVWQEALGASAVGVHDNFFDRGGHSLLSMEVIARVARETGIRLSPRAMLVDSLERIATAIPTPP